ncbi:hypothetical protein PPN31114_03492 [Pandoraea pneumonica]|uniref:Uncharacterized protein n=1 Tax=Pandoraea pneumonica TaxID=2508299 RepID=A0A5E4WW51_9BURK|nr:hypothetical protein [Pandoraea pneumonica]VVE27814.1 hypothetical protein PPN31114_03492 [Pandoraea pneumonica]
MELTRAAKRRFDMLLHIIPYYKMSVEYGLHALQLASKHNQLAPLRVYVDQEAEPVHETTVNMYTHPISNMAAVHCRLLLEFVGLRSGGQLSDLVEIKERKKGDVGIEDFWDIGGSPLHRLPLGVVHRFPQPEKVRRAWVATCDFAGQRLAHATYDNKLNGVDVTPMLHLAFETVPRIVGDEFLAKAQPPFP